MSVLMTCIVCVVMLQTAAFGTECDLAIGLGQYNSSAYSESVITDYDAQKAKCVEVFNSTLIDLLSRPPKNETPIIGEAVRSTLYKGVSQMMGNCQGSTIKNVKSFSVEAGYNNDKTFYVNQITIQEIVLNGTDMQNKLDNCQKRLKLATTTITNFRSTTKNTSIPLTPEDWERFFADAGL